MAPFKPFLLRRSCISVAWRASLLLGVIAGSVAVAAEERSGSERRGHSYVVDVPVVSAKPIEVTRTVERPEKTCKRLSQSGQRSRSSDYSRRDATYERRHDRRNDRRRGVGAQILGGLIGGAIGNQFGGGKGKTALTIAGALIGSSVARGRRHRPDDGYYDEDFADDRYYSGRRQTRGWDARDFQPEYHCRTTIRSREVTDVTGYDVTYRYNQTLYKRRMDYDPGDTLELRVRAVPDSAPNVADS